MIIFVLISLFLNARTSLGDALIEDVYPVTSDHATLLNGAQFQDCGFCSSGKRVVMIGAQRGVLEFTGVSMQDAGNHRLRIEYVNGDSTARQGLIQVNSGPAYLVKFPPLSWDKQTSTEVVLPLSAGMNDLKFISLSWLPDISRIAVTRSLTSEVALAPTSDFVINGFSIQKMPSPISSPVFSRPVRSATTPVEKSSQNYFGLSGSHFILLFLIIALFIFRGGLVRYPFRGNRFLGSLFLLLGLYDGVHTLKLVAFGHLATGVITSDSMMADRSLWKMTA